MGLIHLQSLDDTRLDAYARLTDLQMRSRLEPEKAILVAESENVIVRALEAGLEPLSMLTSEKRLQAAQGVVARLEEYAPDLPAFVLPDEEFERLAGFKLTRSALAVFRRPAMRSFQSLMQAATRICVLEDITNHTNVGAIFRSAAALGVDAVLVNQGCCDPYYRRAARVSMGAVFQVPWTRVGQTGDAIAELRDAGFVCLAMALKDDALALDDPAIKAFSKIALVLGTEGTGLAAKTIAACDHSVVIPMHHGVDSLNVAAASAVAFWETRPGVNLGGSLEQTSSGDLQKMFPGVS